MCVLWCVIYSNYNFISLFKSPSLIFFFDKISSHRDCSGNEYHKLSKMGIWHFTSIRFLFIVVVLRVEILLILSTIRHISKLAPRSRNENNNITAAAAITTTKLTFQQCIVCQLIELWQKKIYNNVHCSLPYIYS